jgi:hypothetical protein
MERRFRVRLGELLDDAEVRPGLLRGMAPRLEAFLRPFADILRSAEQRTNASRRTVNRRLRRNEEARLYHWRRRNRLPPRRLDLWT